MCGFVAHGEAKQDRLRRLGQRTAYNGAHMDVVDEHALTMLMQSVLGASCIVLRLVRFSQ